MLIQAPAFIFYPLLLIWSLVYGAPAGVLFKLLSVVENWQATNRYHLILWKKYPKRSYQKYISTIWASEIRDKPVELAEYTRHKVEKSHPAEPFPMVKILLNTLFMLFITPFLMVTGLFLGPSYVFKRAVSSRRQLLNQSNTT